MSSLEQSSPFASPEEELAYLRRLVAERESQLEGTLERVPEPHERERAATELVREYQQQPASEVLDEEHIMPAIDIYEYSLDLPKDDDDETIADFLAVAHERGIKNALTIIERLQSPHLEDDFHRALVQYIREGHPAAGLKEGSPEWQALQMTLFEVAFPGKGDEEGGRSLKELISATEQFYAGMLSIADERTMGKRHFTIEIAVSESSEEIVFYVAVPTDKRSLFEKHLSSLFPEVRLHEQKSDYNIFVRDGYAKVATATLAEEHALPLKSYESFDHDPLNVLISVFSKFATTGEGAAVQLVVRPAGERYQKQYRKALELMQKGKKLREALRESDSGMSAELKKAAFEIFRGGPKKKEDELKDASPIDQEAMEAVREKVTTPIVMANLRVAASAEEESRAESILSEILSSFNQFASPAGNHLTFKTVGYRRSPEALRNFTYRKFVTAQNMPLSLRELTTLVHFPAPGTVHATSEFKSVKSGAVAAPLGLPQEGTFLGTNTYRGKESKAFLTPKDKVRHMYVIGQTGTGKSVLLQNMCVQDIQQGHGVCFIDPHGSDVQDILAAVPPHRYEDVIYFDPGHTETVLGLNMLEYDESKPEQKTFVINELLGIFKKLYSHSPESMGPAFEQYFRNATGLVIEDPASGNTLMDISRVLTDEAYRAFKLARSKNPVVNSFWRDQASKTTGDSGLNNIAPYITNKFDVFTANDIMRPIIAQPKSSFNMRELMDNRKILLVNLSKGKLGDINANLIGLILVGKILMAALSRVDMHGERPPFYLYIDEFQNVTTDSISAILSEARKYALGLTVAHQFIAQLEQGIRDAVFGNVGSMACFRVGTEDAEFMERQFAPVFEARDIMNIDNYNCYLRLLANGVPQTPFNVLTPPPPTGNPEVREKLKQLSFAKYGTPREEIEAMLQKRYGKGL